jgi:hypothetical protein
MHTTVEESKREDLYAIIKKTLKKEYIGLKVKKIALLEDFKRDTSQVNCSFSENGGKAINLKSNGCGMVDALFNALLEYYSDNYPSLKGITFEGISILPDWRTRAGLSGSDAEIEVEIKFTNSSNSVMTFRNKGKSFVTTTALGILDAIEFYINSEKAFKKLKFLIDDAQMRKRWDISQQYTSSISAIVGVTSYEEL